MKTAQVQFPFMEMEPSWENKRFELFVRFALNKTRGPGAFFLFFSSIPRRPSAQR
jgi:hypothetical protein